MINALHYESPVNGVIIAVYHAGEVTSYVYQSTDDDRLKAECWAEVLRELNDEHGPAASRYSAARVRIVVEPGDKYVGPEG